ncbi:MAG: lanthionine synthetase C family protein [Bacteroidetes bacterium]|nr:lanthionine synthetase C family protein [Bacteroidota bacterium]
MEWEVFLPDNYIRQTENKIHEIAQVVLDHIPDDAGLMGGKAGLACFCAYYADWTGKLSFEDLAADMLERALNHAVRDSSAYTFSNGLAGTAWMCGHLVEHKFLKAEKGNIYDTLDPILYKAMMSNMREGHYDYLHGAMGIALYFLRTEGLIPDPSYLKNMLHELEKHAEIDTDGSIKWISVLDSETGRKGYNISLSHGISSIIIMLSKILTAGIASGKCRHMIRGSLKYLERQELDRNQYISFFPSWALESTEEVSNSRLAWCYGDLGIGLAFLTAGKALADEKIYSKGLNILSATTFRKDPGDNHVVDAGICHGASGIALIYNNLYHVSGMEVFKSAAIHWLDVCLNMAFHKDGLAGYKAWYSEEYGGWRKSADLLEGVAGIGLVLLSFVSMKTAGWDECLLLP